MTIDSSAAVLQLPKQARYEHFIRRAADSGRVWSLYRNGWAIGKTDDGALVFPLWPTSALAQQCAVLEWEAFAPHALSVQELLDELLPQLEGDGILPGITYTPDEYGLTPSHDQLRADLRARQRQGNPTEKEKSAMHILPHDGLALAWLDEQLLQPGTKGLPITGALRQGALGLQGWNVLQGDTSFPVAILKTSSLLHNLAWMRSFCERYGVTLAPHGKTTMSPQLFAAQLANGAWGMTLATATQVQVAHRFGVRRVLLANQLVGRSDIRSVLELLRGDPDFECIVLADSLAGVARLADAVSVHSLARPLPVLVELGLAGKRAGCRTSEEAITVARSIAGAPGLQLAGFEGYEGLLVSSDRGADLQSVDAFLMQLMALVRGADDEGLFTGSDIIVSAGGSSYFDLVARRFGQLNQDGGGFSRPLRAVLRSGCYLTSDHGTYHRLLEELDAREDAGPGLRPALEVWSMVQSRPEPTLAILTMGKRDASYDADLPIPLLHHRPGPGSPRPFPDGCAIFKLNDQHAYLRLPEGHPLCSEMKVGDLVGCGISHPCTTFDKWPLLLCVDDDYQVRGAVNTCF